MTLDRMRSCMGKLAVRFRSYGLIHLLVAIGPNVVSRPQTPKSMNFLRYNDFSGFILYSEKNEVLFVKIGAMVLD